MKTEIPEPAGKPEELETTEEADKNLDLTACEEKQHKKKLMQCVRIDGLLLNSLRVRMLLGVNGSLRLSRMQILIDTKPDY